MTDAELRDAAIAELKQTTVGWNKAKNYSPAKLAGTHWGKGLDLLAKISAANAATRDRAVSYLKKTTRGYSATATNWKQAMAELSKIKDTQPVITWEGRYFVTSGGTITGRNFDAEDGSYGNCIVIQTAQPVVFKDCRFRSLVEGSPQYMIDAYHAPFGADITFDNCYIEGGSTVTSSPRWLVATNFKSLKILNCTIVRTRGIELWEGTYSNATCDILRNRQTNILGAATDMGLAYVGNFFQLRVMRNTHFEIGWNEILGEYGLSEPEDIMSIYHTRNGHIFDNYCQHHSHPRNTPGASISGITLDTYNGGPNGVDDWIVERNQMVDGMGIYVASQQSPSFNVTVRDNRIIADQYLPNGQLKRNGWQGLTIKQGTNFHCTGNLVGYYGVDNGPAPYNNPSWYRNDADISGAVEGWGSNTSLNHDPTSADEQAEWTFWQSKLAANGVKVGSTLTGSGAGPHPSTDWTTIAQEWGMFTLTQTEEVRFGDGALWTQQTLTPGTYECSINTFGADPAPGVQKHCEARSAQAPTYLLNDEFTTFDSTRWQRRWWWNGDDYADGGGGEESAYRDANVTVAGGILSLTAQREATTDFVGRPRAWASGMIQSGGIQGGAAAGFTFTYGLVEVRAKMPAGGPGFWPALWLCNANYTDYCSHEMDILEVVSQAPSTANYNYHYNGMNLSSGGYTHTELLSNAYHVYGFEWRPTFIRWLFDGVEKQRYTSSTQISSVPHYIICNFQVGGSWPGPTSGATPSPASMLIDYVRVSP